MSGTLREEILIGMGYDDDDARCTMTMTMYDDVFMMSACPPRPSVYVIVCLSFLLPFWFILFPILNFRVYLFSKKIIYKNIYINNERVSEWIAYIHPIPFSMQKRTKI